MEGLSSTLQSMDLLASNSNLSRLAEGAKSNQQSTMEQHATEFESLFLSMLMKEMRNTLGDGSLFGGESSDVYGGLFDMMMGDALAESEPLGIARSLQNSLANYQNGVLSESAQDGEADGVDVSL